MKKAKILIPVLSAILMCSACSNGSNSGSITSSSSYEEGASAASSNFATSSKVYDTTGKEVTSGSANVSFVYGRQTTTKTISAAYLVDGVTVNITSGEYISASSSSNQVVFLVINGGSLNIKGTSSSYVNVTKSGSQASNGQVDDDYNFYGINSGIVVSGSASSATIEYASLTTSESCKKLCVLV